MPRFYLPVGKSSAPKGGLKHIPKKMRDMPAKTYTVPDPNKAERVRATDAKVRKDHMQPGVPYSLPDEYVEIRRKP